jgi:Rieske Fe-S protein
MSGESNRREFLRAGGCFALVLAAAGLSPGDAFAWVSGTQENGWRRYPIPTADGVSIDRDAQVMIVRVQNEVVALSMVCPHQNAAVKWIDGDHRFQCTRHNSRYEPAGTYISGRATRNLDRFPVRKEEGTLLVDVTRVYQSDKDAAGWRAAFVTP